VLSLSKHRGANAESVHRANSPRARQKNGAHPTHARLRRGAGKPPVLSINKENTMKMRQFLALSGLLIASFTTSAAPLYAGKKVLFIDSYSPEYVWSAKLATSIKNVLAPEIIKGQPDSGDAQRAPTGIEFRVLSMDTKRNLSEEFKQMAALKAKAEIESFKPDVVIACDDNASKYLIVPFYKDADLPFVFCGVNWDASVYGYPFKNVTGMVEVDLVEQITKNLKPYAKGGRIGMLGADDPALYKLLENYQKVVGLEFTKLYFPADFSTWKQDFLRAQKEVDMLIISSHAAVKGWDDAQARAFVEANSEIPAGTPYDWEIPYALLGLTLMAEEHGVWAAETALKILGGTPASEIPIVTNKQGHLMLNLHMADKLNIAFKPGMLKLAEIIR
jgi:ABC-type uncharacterized transport system substrate-binding protein